MITVKYLKELYIEKYFSLTNSRTDQQVLVTLTRSQYEELNDDLMNISGNGILLLVDESELEKMHPEEILYTKIHIPNVCEFLVELGDEFSIRLLDETQEIGEEDL